MAQTRSPAYPGVHLNQAIDMAGKIYAHNRTNPVDREAAAKDMGFAGMTGSSSKALADLAHYGLVEKAGKGALRVSQRAVDIIYPASDAGKRSAVIEAAFSPALFHELRAQFPDGIPSENNLRSYLMRTGFATSAIPYVLNSYRETCRIAQEVAESESYGETKEQPTESALSTESKAEIMSDLATLERPRPAASILPSPAQTLANPQVVPPLNRIGMNIQGDKVLLSGLLDLKGLDALEKKIAALRILLDVEVDENDTGDTDVQKTEFDL